MFKMLAFPLFVLTIMSVSSVSYAAVIPSRKAI